jgi:LDH2 family malate/lactate/ureidoglycolate dehydrogenase
LVILTDEQLRELGTKIFEAMGTPNEEAAWVAECLVLSNLKGVDSHGVQQIPGYVKAIQEGTLKPGAKLTLLKEMTATAFFDGGDGFGYTMAREAMESTIRKAKDVGVAYSGIRNIHHIGRVGRWAEMALEEDMIGIASQPGGVYIAPWGGIERKLPIAPIAIAIPTWRHPPIVIDMSLGPIAGGRNSILALRQQKVPLGWLMDGEGKPTDNPAIFHRGEGAQRPLGQTGLGYKGMALSMVIDIFAGPLLGYFAIQGHPFQRRGVFLGAINIEAFTPIDAFKKGMDELIANVKSSKLAPGFKEIMTPGEPEWREQERRLREGIFLDDAIYQRVLDTAESVGVDTSRYKGKPGIAEITHPSYTLKDRY